MYRDERTAIGARLSAARDARDTALASCREQVDAITTLNEQLAKKGFGTEQVHSPLPTVSVPDDPDALSLADELKLCDALEREAAGLAGERERLARVIELMNDRAQGRSVLEPLLPPPRRVPASYFLAELVTWYGIFSLASLAVGAATKSSGVGAWPIGLVAVCLLLTLFRPWAMEFRFLPLLIFHISIGMAAATVLGFLLAPRELLRSHPMLALTLAVVAVLGVDAWHATRRWAFLARCKVASAQLAWSDTLASKYTSWPLPFGRGWDSGVEAYSGMGHKNRIEYRTDEGYTGHLTVEGPPWQDAVVLYDPERPSRALPVQAFGCAPRPGLDGAWRAGLGGWRAWRVMVAAMASLFAIVELVR